MSTIYGYNFIQALPLDTWVIKHNLGLKPVVQVFVDHEGKLQRIIPKSIVANSNTQVTVTFSVPFSGHAVLM